MRRSAVVLEEPVALGLGRDLAARRAAGVLGPSSFRPWAVGPVQVRSLRTCVDLGGQVCSTRRLSCVLRLYSLTKGIIEGNIFILKSMGGETECWLPFVSLQNLGFPVSETRSGGPGRAAGCAAGRREIPLGFLPRPARCRGASQQPRCLGLREPASPRWPPPNPWETPRKLCGFSRPPARPECRRWRPRCLPAPGPRFCLSSLGHVPALGDQS